MRILLTSVLALGTLVGAGAAAPADARTAITLPDPSVQTVQYYEPGWHEREDWRRRREFEWRRREEWRRRQEWRAAHAYPPPPGYYAPPPAYYGPRY